MATSTKIVLRKTPNKAGLYPIAIRITKNRSSTYKFIGEYIPLKDWDVKNKLVKKSNPESEHINDLIDIELKKAKKGVKSLKKKNRDTDAHKIKKEIYTPSRNVSFFEFAQEHLDDLEASENYGRLSTDSSLISYIRSFNKSNNLEFRDINERYLKKFKIYLKKEHGLVETSIMNVFVLIRLLFNRAIRNKIVKRKFYPFGKDKVQIKFPETQKIGWNKWEIMLLEQIPDLSFDQLHARNLFMFSFNFAGVRISDVLKSRWSDFKNGRYYYRMGKNNKLVSLKVPKKVYDILEYYKKDKRHSNDYIFPELKAANVDDSKDIHRIIKVSGKKINRHLKNLAKMVKVEKKLTMHIARHSFGHIAEDKIHPKKLQKLYRHSDLKTTIGYQANFIHSDADEALDSVINF